MNNVFHKKTWNMGTLKVHVQPPPIILIKSKNDDKSDKDCVKIKFSRYPASQQLDLYEIKTALFDNGEPYMFLLFIINFNMTLEVSRTTLAGSKIQYLHTLVRGEVLHWFDNFSDEVGSTTPENLTYISFFWCVLFYC